MPVVLDLQTNFECDIMCVFCIFQEPRIHFNDVEQFRFILAKNRDVRVGLRIVKNWERTLLKIGCYAPRRTAGLWPLIL